MKIVSFSNLSKCYGNVCALDSVSLDICVGECFGLLGPNGAGKTTAMEIIYCFTVPTSGSAHVFGIDVLKAPSEIKAALGVMHQENNLDPDLSVYENLMVFARYFDIPKRIAEKRVQELIKFTELEDKVGVNIRRLSGGMVRRLMLARALVNSPKLLVLDEPTTGLDPSSRRQVWEMLGRLRSGGTTVIISTHYMEEAERICDRVAIMDRGKIIVVDEPTLLMNHYGGNLEDVYLRLTGKTLES